MRPHMPSSNPPTEKRFGVWVIDGSIHSGHDTDQQANSIRDRVENDAKKMGLAARYEVRENLKAG